MHIQYVCGVLVLLNTDGMNGTNYLKQLSQVRGYNIRIFVTIKTETRTTRNLSQNDVHRKVRVT